MQTFLPEYSFTMSAKALDNRRLFKQVVEAKQIILANQRYESAIRSDPYREPKVAWKNHPAVRMWRGYEPALALYAYVMALESINRGIKANNLAEWFSPILDKSSVVYPEWMKDYDTYKSIITSHRASLIHKMPQHYARLWPNTPRFTNYVWPV